MVKSMNFMGKIKNLFRLIIVLFTINTILFCKKQPDDYPKNVTHTEAGHSIFRESKNFQVTKNYTTEPIKSFDIKFQNYIFRIRYIEDRAYIQYVFDDKIIQDWQLLKINFFYDSSYEIAEKDIHILYNPNKSAGIILLPSFTEEYSSYFIYKFDSKKIQYLKDISANANLPESSNINIFEGIESGKKINISYLNEKGERYKFIDREEIPINKNIKNINDLHLLNSENSHNINNNSVISLKETMWSINCNPSERNITFEDEKKMVISMEFNQYYITLQEKSRKGNVISYQYGEMSGLGSVDYNSKSYDNTETVCTLEIIDENTLKFNWLGFYDKDLKKRVQSKNPLNETKKMVDIIKCE